MADTSEAVTQCEDGSFCCGPQAEARGCCNSGQGVWIKDGKETRSNPALSVAMKPLPIGSSGAPTSRFSQITVTKYPPRSSVSAAVTLAGSDVATPLRSSQVTVTKYPTKSSLPTAVPRAGSNTRSIVGGTVGGLVILLILCVGVWLCWRKRRTRKATLYMTELGPGDVSNQVGSTQMRGKLPVSELQNPGYATELWAGRVPLGEIDSRNLHEAAGPAHRDRQ